MVVRLSPKAKALTLPLNWSQFLKTLIGAENYTLFQLPPNKTSVRPPRRPLLSIAILCYLSSSPPSLEFLPLGYFFSAVSNRWKYRDWMMTNVRANETFIELNSRELYVDRLRTKVLVIYETNSLSVNAHPSVGFSSCHSRDKSVPLCKKSPVSTLVSKPCGYPFNKLVVACRAKRAAGDVP